MSLSNKVTFATLPRTTRGMPLVVSGDPKGKNILYTNGNSVVIRDVANPMLCDIYTEHSAQTIVAKYSPSGYYIASGDVHGKLRIWDTTQKEHILKNEFQPISGPIKDIAWSGDNQRIVVVGDGREKYGHVFNSETGTSVGEIYGHSKSLNSVDFRADRPYRIVTAGEDNQLGFFHGPPFKFNMAMKDHTRFVNAVRYAHDGSMFASGGADGKSFLYDGKTAELKGQFGDPAHSGGIYAVSFSPDNSQLLTVSADKSAKIWDVATMSCVTEFKLGTTVEDMQVGGIWQGDYLLSVSLSGHINYLDRNNPNTPLRIVKGHNKPITAMALSGNRDTVYTGASDGKMCHWDLSNGDCDVMKGKGHANQIQDMVECEGQIISCGFDDVIVFTSAASNEYGTSLKMPSQPRGIAAVPGGLVIVACINEVVVVRNQGIVYSHRVDWEPSCVSIHPGCTQVAVGGGQTDMKVHLFTLDHDTLREESTFDHAGMITDITYSPDGSRMAVGDSNRRIILYNVDQGYQKASFEWVSHMARVNSVSWTPDSKHLASGALDCALILWTPEKPLECLIKRGAHPQYQITRLRWSDNNTLITTAQDSSVKIWNVEAFP